MWQLTVNMVNVMLNTVELYSTRFMPGSRNSRSSIGVANSSLDVFGCLNKWCGLSTVATRKRELPVKENIPSNSRP